MIAKKGSWKQIQGGIAAPLGFYAGGAKAGIKYKNKYDIALIFSEVLANAAGVFTKNLVKAHPVILTQKHLALGKARAIIVNSGNANACMGESGERAARQMAEKTASELGISTTEVLVSSTGVIGQPLPMEKLIPGIEAVTAEVKKLRNSGERELLAAQSHNAALAIMTTDSVVKERAWELQCGEGTVKLGLIAKGSGMIHPNMGTLLCFITTDAKIESDKLNEALREATEESFNMVSIDGDTSTNDMVLILANGLSGVALTGNDWQNFVSLLKEACCTMAKMIAADGEGAGKLLEVIVKGAATLKDARLIARSICSSSLVKSAIYGSDANWGRILAAAGYSGAYFKPEQTGLFLNGLQVAANGQGVEFSEEEALRRLKRKEIVIEVVLKEGPYKAKAWGCDLTPEYIDINANYRT
jgi:glutamate N-acetyltransferase/amino-acid N-acetyltransferase